MRPLHLKSFLGCMLFAAIAAGLGAAPAGDVGRSDRLWKPMADWYRPGLRAPALAPRSVQQSELRVQLADDPRFAATDWDDSHWTVIQRNEVPLNQGIFWLRLRVKSTDPVEAIPSLIMIGGGISGWECYWDGVFTSRSGVPGTSADSEKEADAAVRFDLPLALATPGEHVVALRVSTFRSSKVGSRFAQLLFWTLPPQEFRKLDAKLSLLPAMGLGAMLTTGLAVLLMWVFADRQLILALLAALCFGAAALIAVATAPMVFVYPASWSYLQTAGRVGSVTLVASLLLVTVWVHLFPLCPRRWLFLPVLVELGVVGCWLHLGVNDLNPILWRVALLTASMIAAWATWRRREGAWLVLGGTAITYSLFERDPKHFEHSDFLFCFLPLLIGLIAGIALRVRRERLKARDTKLTAARLEIELLKKSLQPHFLMNTLTALSQVIEEKPATAVRLIDDLASEFRALARFAGQKRVTLGEELALCRAHLGVMSVRTDRAWALQTEGLDPTATVPPALFLTLIENGFSHQRARRSETTFSLRAERLGPETRYTFISPGAVKSPTNRADGGTGLRYISARLEESFPGRWKLTQNAASGGWATVIQLLHSTSSELAT